MIPKVSIIIIACNCEGYIQNTILSATQQTEPNVEIIFVDDGSTDDTLSIVKQMALMDRRIAVYAYPHSGKPSVARNHGIERAKGEYICFLDGDDLYHKEKVKRQLSVLETNPEIPLAFHDMKYIDKDGKELTGSYLEDGNFKERAHRYLQKINHSTFICNENFYHFMSVRYAAMHTSTVMIHRSLFDERNFSFP